MNKKSCSFTGHRYIPKTQEMITLVKEKVRSLVKEGYTEFYNGGAIGFDMLCALIVIELKKEYDISLNLLLPCEDQAEKWSDGYKKTYRYIIDNADSVEYISKEYTPGCMQKRNRALVDKCDLLIAYEQKGFGGTFYTVSYAKKQGKMIINLAL